MATLRLLRSIDSYARKKPAALAKKIGGKAARLAWLSRHGLPVPKTWVLDAEPFRDLVQSRLSPGHDPHSLLRLRTGAVMLERAARARHEILREPLETDLADDLSTLWESIRREAPWGLAVRASATSDDDYLMSMAGLGHSAIGIRGARDLTEAVKEAWASALLPDGLVYLASQGVRDIAMGVIFQLVVRADAAGVMVTGSPDNEANGAFGASEILINASIGLGVPVLDGRAASDVVRVERATGRVIDYFVAEKPHGMVVGARGVEEVTLDSEGSRKPAVDGTVLARLAEYARKLEPLGAFDVEFAVEGQKVWIVQARPAEGTGYPEGGESDTVWSRASIAEALTGAATPLTWSVAQTLAERGVRHAFASLGCPVPRGLRLTTRVHGRFYLNLTNLMRLAAQVPGVDPKTLLDLGAAPHIDVLERQVAHVSRRSFYTRLPLTAARLLAEQMRLGGEVDRFEGQATRVTQRLAEMDLTILPDDALATTLRDVRALLEQAGTLMLSCSSASFASHIALKTVLARLMPVGSERIAQALAAGIGDLESARPGLVLAHIAAIARHDEPVRALLERHAVRSPDDLPDGPTRRALISFLETYGDRAVREAELMAPRWREDPAPVLAMLRAAIHAAPADPDVALARAHKQAAQELAQIEARLSRVEMALVRALVTRSQRFARLRERMRVWVTRVLAVLRAVALDIDRRLIRVDPAIGPLGVFFCTFDELVVALATGRVDLGRLVTTRRAEFARNAARPEPPATFLGRPHELILPAASGTVMHGLPASGGVVEGRARVLSASGSAAGDLGPGEILVARTCDAGLSPLFLVAAGIVTELGGPLSHAALVAREYGVPAVVHVTSATTVIRTGDLLRVDGGRGIVERIPSQDGVP